MSSLKKGFLILPHVELDPWGKKFADIRQQIMLPFKQKIALNLVAKFAFISKIQSKLSYLALKLR